MLPIAKEFRTVFTFGTLILLALQMKLGLMVAGLWLFWFPFAFFVRDFHRDIPPIPLAAISPADGTVADVSTCTDPYLNRQALCYTIHQSMWGEFNLHSPIEGKVEQLWLREPTNNHKALVFWIQTDEQDDVVVHIELHSRWRHASTTLHPGERVGQGRRCGFAASKCRVHVYMPENAQSVVQRGDKVIAGKNIIAKLVH